MQRWYGARLALFVILTVSSLLLTAPSYLIGQELLRWKFQRGTVYEVTFRQQTASKTRIADQSFEVQLNMSLQMNWKILEVGTDGHAGHFP